VFSEVLIRVTHSLGPSQRPTAPPPQCYSEGRERGRGAACCQARQRHASSNRWRASTLGITVGCQFDREPVPGLSVILDAGQQGEQHMGRDELVLILKSAEELWNSIIANV
jgi:hypothetical protein